MGGVYLTCHTLQIHKIDAKLNLIYIKGHVPGHKGQYVRIRDAMLKRPFEIHGQTYKPPFPTFFADPENDQLPVLVEPELPYDPFEFNMDLSELSS